MFPLVLQGLPNLFGPIGSGGSILQVPGNTPSTGTMGSGQKQVPTVPLIDLSSNTWTCDNEYTFSFTPPLASKPIVIPVEHILIFMFFGFVILVGIAAIAARPATQIIASAPELM